MKPSERDTLLYLQDIVVSIERIREYLSGFDFERFEQDYKTVDAVIRNFEVIGEASRNLPKSIKDKYTNVPWEEMYRLRNRISHEYFGIDYGIIWNIAKMQLPLNHEDILKILNIEKADRQ